MAQEPNRLLRVIVPIVLLGAGVGIFFAVMKNTAGKAAGPIPAPATTSAPAVAAPNANAGDAKAPATDAAAKPVEKQPEKTVEKTAGKPVEQSATTNTTYSAKTYPFTSYEPIGALTPKDKGGAFEMEVRFSGFGAGIEQLALANYFKTIRRTDNEVVQTFRALPQGLAPDGRYGLCGFAMNKVEIDGKTVELGLTPDATQTFWKQTAHDAASATFEAAIADAEGKAALRITRRYALTPGTYDLTLEQRAENLTDHAMKIVWHQFGPASLPSGTIRYGGDVRRVRFGYMQPKVKDPDRLVLADDRNASLLPYLTALGAKSGNFGNSALPRWETTTLWPNQDSTKYDLILAWTGMTSRYFTVAMYPRAAGAALTNPGRGDDKAFTQAASIDRLAIPTGEPPDYGLMDWVMGRERKPIGEMVLRLNTAAMTIEAGKSADVSLGVYAGPTSKTVIAAQPAAAWAGIPQIVLYTFGGPCGFCTFQGVSGLLRGVLTFLHDHVVFDWALSIMLLVVCVRSVLHPITRWSQKSLYKFGKEMSKLGPKQKAIQEKFKDDPVKMREEMGRLMRDEGVSYAGALGCLPAFLQTPVWIGLSAMIYFTFDLRHQPAFFGIFQRISGGAWSFLGDMAEPDKFISFGQSLHVPVLSSFMGPIDGLNVLPLLLGVVFFIQQKYLTPPTTTPLTPEQEQQQKMMKVMTVVLFPLMMYNAPAGLALYFTTNSTFAILESKWIRAKAEEEYKTKQAIAAARALPGARAPGGGAWGDKGRILPKQEGVLARVRRMVEEAQKARMQQGKMKDKRGKR